MSEIERGRTEFCRFDKLFMSLVALYFYDSVLDVESLQKSLDETIKSIPILSSVVRNTGEGKDLEFHFEHVVPSNVQIRTKHLEEETLFDNYQSKGVLNTEEGCSFFQHHEKIETETWVKPKLGVPNLKITLIILNNKKSILAVSINHAIADAHSLIYFMDRWSKGTLNCLVKNFELSRERFLSIMDDEFDAKKVDPKITDPIFLYQPHREPASRKEDLGFMVFPANMVIQSYCHFTPERIQQLKSLVKVPKGTKFSSNDCVSAHLWKLFASLGDVNDRSQEVPMMMIINFRNRVKGIGDSYFGNASFGPGLLLTRGEVLDSTFTDLVMKIRGLIESVGDEMVDCTCNSMKKYQDVAMTLLKKTALYIDDWRLFDHMLPSFGEHHVCQRGVLSPPGGRPYLGTQFYLVHLHPKGGLNVKLSFHKDVFEKIKDVEDLSDPLALPKIQELMMSSKKKE